MNETLCEESSDKHQMLRKWNECKHKYTEFFEDPYEIKSIPYKD